MGGIPAGRQGKKLTEAAAFWARGGKPDGDSALDDLVLFGVDRATAQEWLGDLPAEEFSVWPDNWPTVQLFLALQTQWRVALGMGQAVWMGLDYAAAQAAMQMLGVARKDRQETFAGLCAMERAALPLLNRKKEA